MQLLLLIRQFACGTLDRLPRKRTIHCKRKQQRVSSFDTDVLYCRCLAEFILPSKSGDPSAVSISYDLSRLVVGCDNGDMIEFKLSSYQLNKYRQTARKFRSDITTGKKHQSIAQVQSSTRYPTGDEWHEGYVDDVCIIGQDGDKESALYNTIGRVDLAKHGH